MWCAVGLGCRDRKWLGRWSRKEIDEVVNFSDKKNPLSTLMDVPGKSSVGEALMSSL